MSYLQVNTQGWSNCILCLISFQCFQEKSVSTGSGQVYAFHQQRISVTDQDWTFIFCFSIFYQFFENFDQCILNILIPSPTPARSTTDFSPTQLYVRLSFCSLSNTVDGSHTWLHVPFSIAVNPPWVTLLKKSDFPLPSSYQLPTALSQEQDFLSTFPLTFLNFSFLLV